MISRKLLLFFLISLAALLTFIFVEGAQPQTTSNNVVDSPGFSPSVAFGQDGLPIIAYHDRHNPTGPDTSWHLKIAKCNDLACSTKTITEVDTHPDSGFDSSIAVPPDGLPVISYYARDISDPVSLTPDGIRVLKCGNASCSSGNTITDMDQAALLSGPTSIAIGNDGLPVIAYYAGDQNLAYYLKVGKCTQPDCSSFDREIISNSSSDKFDITIGADGNPIIATIFQSNFLTLFFCQDPLCSLTKWWIVDASNMFFGPSITLNTDGLPIVSYVDAETRELKFVKCKVFNNQCMGEESMPRVLTKMPAFTNEFEKYVAQTDINLDSDGLPLIAYYAADSSAKLQDMRVIKCHDKDCISFEDNLIGSTGGLSAFARNAATVDIKIDQENSPLIVYEYISGEFGIKAARCGLDDCPKIGISDTVPPVTSITSPSNDSTVSGIITISVTASDNVGVMKVDFYYNTTLITSDTTSPYSLNWDTASILNGSYILTTKAYDGAGNIGTSDPISITVSNEIPLTVSNVTAIDIADTSVTISWATNKPADSQVEYGVSLPYENLTVLDTNLVTDHSVKLIGLEAGTTYNYRAASRDVDGNLAISSNFTFTTSVVQDTTPPTIFLDSPSSGLTLCCTVAITAEASDNVGITKVEFWLNARDLLATDTTPPYSYSWDTTTVMNGDYTIAAKVYDQAGSSGISNFSTVTIFNQQLVPEPEPTPEPEITPTLIKSLDDPRVYEIINGKKHWISNPEVLNSYGFDWVSIRVVSQQEINSYPRIKLVRPSTSPKVYYITESGMKRWIPSAGVFVSYGNKWEDIVSINSIELNSYSDNVLMHLDNDPKVYKLEETIKRWIKTADAFNRLGYDWGSIAPVNTTEFSFYTEGTSIE